MNLLPRIIIVAAIAAAIAIAFELRAKNEPQPTADKPIDLKQLDRDQLDGREGRPLALENFRPKSMLRVARHPLDRAKFPVVDVHTHPTVRLSKSPAQELDDFVRVMDEQNIAVCVSLDGGLGPKLAEHIDFLWTKYRARFVIFANIDFRGTGEADKPATWACNQPDFVAHTVEQLRAAKALGASGLKFFKEFGLGHRNADGSLIRIDDPRWDAIWQACARLDFPILIHAGDPAAFFEPIGPDNERWEELSRHPDWSFHGRDPHGNAWPTHADILASFLRVVAKHPRTRFIAAHMANNAEDLATVGKWLDTYPNLNVEIAARIGELGRQPVTARAFFLKYHDRILFGTDGPRTPARLKLHWRFLETADEYFPYAENPFPPQGFWNIYGLHLPDEILKSLYQENASHLIPTIKQKLAAQQNK